MKTQNASNIVHILVAAEKSRRLQQNR